MTIFQTAVPKVRQTVVLRENRGSTMGEPTVGPKDQPTAALPEHRARTTAERTAERMEQQMTTPMAGQMEEPIRAPERSSGTRK
jgi:hypothetical protein